MTIPGRYDDSVYRLQQRLQSCDDEEPDILILEAFQIYDNHVSELSIESRQAILGMIINRLQITISFQLVEYLEIIINTECELVKITNNNQLFNQQMLHQFIILTKESLLQDENSNDDQLLEQLLVIVHHYVCKCADYSVFCPEQSIKEVLTGKFTEKSLKFVATLINSLQNMDEDFTLEILKTTVNNVNEKNVLSAILVIKSIIKWNDDISPKLLNECNGFYKISSLCMQDEGGDTGMRDLLQLLREIFTYLKVQKHNSSKSAFIYTIVKPLEALKEADYLKNASQKVELINIVLEMLSIQNNQSDNEEIDLWQYKTVNIIINLQFALMQNQMAISTVQLAEGDEKNYNKLLQIKKDSFCKLCKYISQILHNQVVQLEKINPEQLSNNEANVSNVLINIKIAHIFYIEYTKCFCQMYMKIDTCAEFEQQVFTYLIIKQLHNDLNNMLISNLKVPGRICDILVYKFELFYNIASIIPETLITMLNNYEVDIILQQCQFEALKQSLSQKETNDEMFLRYVDIMEREHLLRQFYTSIIQSIYNSSPGLYYDIICSYLLQAVTHKLIILDGTSILNQNNQGSQYKFNPYLLKQYYETRQLQQIPLSNLNQLLVELMSFKPEFVYPRGLKSQNTIQNCLYICLEVLFFIQRSGLLNSKIVNQFIINTTVILNKYGQIDTDFEQKKLFYIIQSLTVFMQNEYYPSDTSILEPDGVLPKEINLQVLTKTNDSVLKYKEGLLYQQSDNKQTNNVEYNQQSSTQVISLVNVIKGEFKYLRDQTRVYFMTLLFVISYYPLSTQGMKQLLSPVLRLFCIGINRTCIFSRAFIVQLWIGNINIPDSIGLKHNNFSFLLRDSEIFLANMTSLEIQQLLHSCKCAIDQYNMCFNDIFSLSEKLKYTSIHEKSQHKSNLSNVNQNIRTANPKDSNVNRQFGDVTGQSQLPQSQDVQNQTRHGQNYDKQETSFHLQSYDVPVRVIFTRMLLMPDCGDFDIYNNFMKLCIAPTNLQFCGLNYIHVKSVLQVKKYSTQLHTEMINFQNPCSLKTTAECCLNIISLYQHLVDQQIVSGIQGFDFYCQNVYAGIDKYEDIESKFLIYQQIMMQEDEKVDISYNSILYYAILWLQEQQVYANCYDIFNKDTYDQKNISKLYKIVESCWSIVYKQYTNNNSESGIDIMLLISCTLLIQNLVESYSILQHYLQDTSDIPGRQEFINDVFAVLLKLLTNKKVNSIIYTQTIQNYLFKTFINIIQAKSNQNKWQLYIKPLIMTVIKKPFDYILQYKILDFVKQVVIDLEKKSLKENNGQPINADNKITLTDQEYKDLFMGFAITLQLIHDPMSQYHLIELAKHQIKIQINSILNILFRISDDQHKYNSMLLEVCQELCIDRINYVLYDYAVMTTIYLYQSESEQILRNLLHSQRNKYDDIEYNNSELLIVQSMIFNNCMLDKLTEEYFETILNDTRTGLIITCYLSQLLQVEALQKQETRDLVNQMISNIQQQVQNSFRVKYLQEFGILAKESNINQDQLIQDIIFNDQSILEVIEPMQQQMSNFVQNISNLQIDQYKNMEKVCFCLWICDCKITYKNEFTLLAEFFGKCNSSLAMKSTFWFLQFMKQQTFQLDDHLYSNMVKQLQNTLSNESQLQNNILSMHNKNDQYVFFQNELQYPSINKTYISKLLEIKDENQIGENMQHWISQTQLPLELQLLVFFSIKNKNSSQENILEASKMFQKLVNGLNTQYENNIENTPLHLIVYADQLFANVMRIDNISCQDAQSEYADSLQDISVSEEKNQITHEEQSVSNNGNDKQISPFEYFHLWLPRESNLHLPDSKYAPRSWNKLRQLLMKQSDEVQFNQAERARDMNTLTTLQGSISTLLVELHTILCARTSSDGLEMSLKAQTSSIQSQQQSSSNIASQLSVQASQQSGTKSYVNDTIAGTYNGANNQQHGFSITAVIDISLQLIDMFELFACIGRKIICDIQNTYFIHESILQTFMFIRNEKINDFVSVIQLFGNCRFSSKQSLNKNDKDAILNEFQAVTAEIGFWMNRIQLLMLYQPIVLVELVNALQDNTLINRYINNLLCYHDVVGELTFISMLRISSNTLKHQQLMNIDPTNDASSSYKVMIYGIEEDPFCQLKSILPRLKTIYDIQCVYTLFGSGLSQQSMSNTSFSAGATYDQRNFTVESHFPASFTQLNMLQFNIDRLDHLYASSKINSQKHAVSVYDRQQKRTIKKTFWVKQFLQRQDMALVIENALYNAQVGCMSLSAWVYAAWTRLLVFLVELVNQHNDTQITLLSDGQTVSHFTQLALYAIQRFSSRLSLIYSNTFVRHVSSNTFVCRPVAALIVEANIFRLIRLYMQIPNQLKPSIPIQCFYTLAGPFYSDDALQAITIDGGIRQSLKNIVDTHINTYIQSKNQQHNNFQQQNQHTIQNQRSGQQIHQNQHNQSNIQQLQSEIETTIKQFREENTYIGLYQQIDTNQSLSQHISDLQSQQKENYPSSAQSIEFWPLRLNEHIHYNEIIHPVPEFSCGSSSLAYPYVQLCAMRCLRLSKRFGDYRGAISTLDSMCGISSEFSARLYMKIQRCTIIRHNQFPDSTPQTNSGVVKPINTGTFQSQHLLDATMNRYIRAQALQQKLLSVAIGQPGRGARHERVSLPSLIIRLLAVAPTLHQLDLQATLWLYKLSLLSSYDFSRQLGPRGFHLLERGIEGGLRTSLKVFDFLHHKQLTTPDPYNSSIINDYSLQLLLQRLVALGHATLPVQLAATTPSSIIALEKQQKNDQIPINNAQIDGLKRLKQFCLENKHSDASQLDILNAEPFYRPLLMRFHCASTTTASGSRRTVSVTATSSSTGRLLPGGLDTSVDNDDEEIITPQDIKNGNCATLCIQGVLIAQFFLQRVRQQIDKFDTGRSSAQLKTLHGKFKADGAGIGAKFEQFAAHQHELRAQQHQLKAQKQRIETLLHDFSHCLYLNNPEQGFGGSTGVLNGQNFQQISTTIRYGTYNRFHTEFKQKQEQLVKQLEETNSALHKVSLRIIQVQKDIANQQKKYFIQIGEFCNTVLQKEDRNSTMFALCQKYLNLNSIIESLFQIDKTEMDSILIQNSISCMQQQILMQYLHQNNEQQLIMAYMIPQYICYLSDNHQYVVTSTNKVLYPLNQFGTDQCGTDFQDNNLNASPYICKNTQIKLAQNKFMNPSQIQQQQSHDNKILFKNSVSYKNIALNFDILHFTSEFFRTALGYTNRDANIQFLITQNDYSRAISKLISKPLNIFDVQKIRTKAYEYLYIGIIQYVTNILRENVGEANLKWFNPQLIPQTFICNYNFTNLEIQSGSNLTQTTFVNFYSEILKLQQQQRQYLYDQHIYDSILKLNDFQVLEQIIQLQSPFQNRRNSNKLSKIQLSGEKMEQSQRQQSHLFNNDFQIGQQNNSMQQGGIGITQSEVSHSEQKDRLYSQLHLYFKKLLEQLIVNGMIDNHSFETILQRISQDIIHHKQIIQQNVVQLQQIKQSPQYFPTTSSYDNKHNTISNNIMNMQNFSYPIPQQNTIMQTNNYLYNQQQQQQFQQQQMQQTLQMLQQMQLYYQQCNITDSSDIIEQFLNSTFPGYNSQFYNAHIDKTSYFYNILSKIVEIDPDNEAITKFMKKIQSKPTPLDFEEQYDVQKYREMMECYANIAITQPSALQQCVLFSGGIKRQLGKYILSPIKEQDANYINGGDISTFIPLTQLLQLTKRPNSIAPGIYSFLTQNNVPQQLRSIQLNYSNIIKQIRENQHFPQKHSFSEMGNNTGDAEQELKGYQLNNNIHQANVIAGQQMPQSDSNTMHVNYIPEILQSESELLYQDPDTLIYMLITLYNKYQENYHLIYKIMLVFKHQMIKYLGQNKENYNKYIQIYADISLLKEFSDKICYSYNRQKNVQKIIEYVNDYQQRCYRVQHLDKLSSEQLNYICTIRLLILQVINNVITGNVEHLISDEQKKDLLAIKERTICMRLNTITAISYILRNKKCQAIAAYNIAKDLISLDDTDAILLDENFGHIASIISYFRCQILNLQQIDNEEALIILDKYSQRIENAIVHYNSMLTSIDSLSVVAMQQITQLLISSKIEFNFIKTIIHMNKLYEETGDYEDNDVILLIQQYKTLQSSQIQHRRYYQHILSYVHIINYKINNYIENYQSNIPQSAKQQVLQNIYNLTEMYLYSLEELNSEQLHDMRGDSDTNVDLQKIAFQMWIQFFLLPDQVYLQHDPAIQLQIQRCKSSSLCERKNKFEVINYDSQAGSLLDLLIENHQSAIENFGKLQILGSVELLIKYLARDHSHTIAQQKLCALLLFRLINSESPLQKAQEVYVDNQYLQNKIEAALDSENPELLVLVSSDQNAEIKAVLAKFFNKTLQNVIQILTRLFERKLSGKTTFKDFWHDVSVLQDSLSKQHHVNHIGKILLAYVLRCKNYKAQYGCNLKSYLKHIKINPAVWVYQMLRKIWITPQLQEKHTQLIDEARKFFADGGAQLHDFDAIYRHAEKVIADLATEAVPSSINTKLLKLKDLKSFFPNSYVKTQSGLLGTGDALNDQPDLPGVPIESAEYTINVKRHGYYQLMSTQIQFHTIDDFPFIQLNFCNIQNVFDRITLLLIQKPDLNHFQKLPRLLSILQQISFDEMYFYNQIYNKFQLLCSSNDTQWRSGGTNSFAHVHDFRHEIIGNNYVQIFGYAGILNVNQRFKRLSSITMDDFQDLEQFRAFKEKFSSNLATFMLFNQLFWSPKRTKKILACEKTVDLTSGRIVSACKLAHPFIFRDGADVDGKADAPGLPGTFSMMLSQINTFRQSLHGNARFSHHVVMSNVMQHLLSNSALDRLQNVGSADASGGPNPPHDPLERNIPRHDEVATSGSFTAPSIPGVQSAQNVFSNAHAVFPAPPGPPGIPNVPANLRGNAGGSEWPAQNQERQIEWPVVPGVVVCVDPGTLQLLTPEFAIGHLSKQIGIILQILKTIAFKPFTETIAPAHLQAKETIPALSTWLFTILHELALHGRTTENIKHTITTIVPIASQLFAPLLTPEEEAAQSDNEKLHNIIEFVLSSISAFYT